MREVLVDEVNPTCHISSLLQRDFFFTAVFLCCTSAIKLDSHATRVQPKSESLRVIMDRKRKSRAILHDSKHWWLTLL
jgi:hypothetical protein